MNSELRSILFEGWRDHYYHHIYEWSEMGDYTGENPSLRVRLKAAWRTLEDRFIGLVCLSRGHDFIVDGCDAENGSEELHCLRCGYNQTVRF
jgi:hypothetical protein